MKPPVPKDLDLTDFDWMPLSVRRLLRSEFSATPNAEAFRAGVLLWCEAWHQIPASSLPNSDHALAKLAGYGRDVEGFREIKDEALHGFELADDGRLYHWFLAEKALDATKYSRAGQKGAKKRWENKKSLNAPHKEANQPPDQEPPESHDQANQSPSQIAYRGSMALDIDRDKESTTPPLNRKSTKSADARSNERANYRFEGKIIRLREDDYNRWQARFHNIPNYDAALEGLDTWLGGLPADDRRRREWFHVVAGALESKDAKYARQDSGNGADKAAEEDDEPISDEEWNEAVDRGWIDAPKRPVPKSGTDAP